MLQDCQPVLHVQLYLTFRIRIHTHHTQQHHDSIWTNMSDGNLQEVWCQVLDGNGQLRCRRTACTSSSIWLQQQQQQQHVIG